MKVMAADVQHIADQFFNAVGAGRFESLEAHIKQYLQCQPVIFFWEFEGRIVIAKTFHLWAFVAHLPGLLHHRFRILCVAAINLIWMILIREQLLWST